MASAFSFPVNVLLRHVAEIILAAQLKARVFSADANPRFLSALPDPFHGLEGASRVVRMVWRSSRHSSAVASSDMVSKTGAAVSRNIASSSEISWKVALCRMARFSATSG